MRKNNLFKQSKIGILGFTALISSTLLLNEVSAATLSNEQLYEVRTISGSHEGNLVNGALSKARFNQPSHFIKLNNGDIIVSDTNNHVLRQISNGEVSVFAGRPLLAEEQNYYAGAISDGVKSSARFNKPGGLATDEAGNIYVADTANHAIRKVTPEGLVTTLAGNGLLGDVDGKSSKAQFNTPSDVAVDTKGNVYVADTLNHTIRKITPSGEVSTLTGKSTRLVEYVPGHVDTAGDFLDGNISDALFNEPTALTLDDKGNLYVTDRGNQRIRYINFESNQVSTIVGSGVLAKDSLYVEGGYIDGNVATAKLNSPENIVILDDSTLLITDRMNHTIRAYKNGVVSTLTGSAEQYGSVDGLLKYATYNEPVDIIVQADKSILVLEAGYSEIRKIALYSTHMKDTFTANTQVVVNNQLIDSKIEIQDGVSLFPLRALGEALQLNVDYDSVKKQVNVHGDEQQFIFTIGSTKAQKLDAQLNSEFLLAKPAQLINNQVYIPLRFVAEKFGYDVAWDEQLKNIVIRDYIFE